MLNAAFSMGRLLLDEVADRKRHRRFGSDPSMRLFTDDVPVPRRCR